MCVGHHANPREYHAKWLVCAINEARSRIQFVKGAASCLLTPHQLCAWAYFSNARGLEQQQRIARILGAKESEVWRHLIAFRSHWDDADQANALDELEDAPAAIWPDAGEAMPPQQLLHRLREAWVARSGPDERTHK